MVRRDPLAQQVPLARRVLSVKLVPPVPKVLLALPAPPVRKAPLV